MKTKKLIIALTITVAMGLGVTAYAGTGSTTVAHEKSGSGCESSGTGLGIVTGMRGHDYVELVLKDKLGMTDAQITDGLNSGKTMYDLAEEKGMTADQFKAALLEEKTTAVDKAVTEGSITTEEGNSLKKTLKSNVDNCTGTPGESGNKGTKGNGRMSGSGVKGSGNCNKNYTVE